MDVASVCPLRVASLLWQPRPGIHVLTVIAKATYQLRPGVSPLAERQEDPNEYDNHWNDDPSRSLYAPADLAPFKPRADVVLVGHAFAPPGTTVRNLIARLVVAGIDKSIEVWPERTVMPDGALHEGPPFAKLPLRWERAAAGADNPVGLRPEPRADRGGGIILPNLYVPGLVGGEAIEPIGFGPIAPTWPSRAAKLPRSLHQLPHGWNHEPLPEGLDPSYFNVAPPDQQVERLRSDETLFLEHLHPEHPQLHTQLTPITPKITVQRGSSIEELPMNPDTLWIDTDRSQCTLTWRAQIRLERPEAAGRIRVGMSQTAPTAPSAPADAPPQQRSGAETHLLAVGQGTPVIEMEVELDEDAEGIETTLPPLRPKQPTMPFRAVSPEEVGTPPAWLPPPQTPAALPEDVGETFIVRGAVQARPVTPFQKASEPGAAPPPSAPAPVSSREAAPPALVHAAPLTDLLPPPLNPSASPAPPPLTVGQAAMNSGGGAIAVPVAPVAPEPVKPLISSVAIVDPAKDKTDPTPRIGSLAALREAGMIPGVPPSSAGAASNAAADPRRPVGEARPAAPQRPRTPIELLWHDPTFVAKIRLEPALRAALADRDKAASPKKNDKRAAVQPAPGPAGQQAPSDRDDITTILATGNPAGIEGISMAMTEAINDRGGFNPPLLLLAGDLEFPFDEVETLKATVAAVTPLAAGDKKLKETIDAVGELLKTPWLQTAGSVTERLTTQVQEAFAAGNRILPAGYLETHTERILLEQRHYQRRTLLGQVWIRALLAAPGASIRVPTYLPHSLARELPMFKRFPARMIAEVRVQADQYESHPSALRVVALGRVLGGPSRR